MRVARIAYAAQTYFSHARTSRAYQEVLSERYEVFPGESAADRLSSVDLAILHIAPFDYGKVYRAYPDLSKKYVISYCMWEADKLPLPYIVSLARVQEVWTCSEYCRSVISQYHSNVHCIPHIVDRNTYSSEADIDSVKRLMHYEDDQFLFLNIVGTADKRKNLGDLLRAFRLASSQMPSAWLIMKVPADTSFPDLTANRIRFIANDMSDSEINALYQLTHAYISTHHGEGWGLTLSDGMLLGKPVIATNYSGNLHFMSDDNSLLISCEERHIAPEDCFEEFNTEMKWGYPDIDDIVAKMVFAYSNYCDRRLTQKLQMARRGLSKFTRSAVSEIIFKRVDEILNSSSIVSRSR